MMSSSEVISQLQPVFARWSVDSLIAADETGEIQVVEPVPLVSRVLDERIDLPPVIEAAESNTRVDYGVGGLQVHRRVDQLEVLPGVPLGIAFDRSYATEHRPFIAGQGVDGPMGSLRHFRRDEFGRGCRNMRCH